MIFNTLLGFVMLTVLATPSLGQTANCFDESGTQADCSDFVKDFCRTISAAKVAPGNTVSGCFVVDADNQIKCELNAKNIITTGGNPDFNSCVQVMTAANNCDAQAGGYGQVKNGRFQFTLDANTGTCDATVPNGN
ncbi:hypothetical protein FB451DRAFT_1569819 [Mycena latifolia]|nr:hypothetical protein FB451DRAFT_1569819 [Mycena latifolia]